MSSCPDCFLRGGHESEGGLSPKPFMSLTLNHKSAVINTSAKKVFTPFILSGSMNHGLLIAFWRQQTLTKNIFMASDSSIDISMISNGSTDNEYQLVPQPQQGLWTPPWPLAAEQATNINMASVDNTGHRNQHGLGRQQGP